MTHSWAWVCGNNATVLGTSNVGTNWLNVSGNGIPTNIQLVNICGIDGSSALVAGNFNSNTFVYRTSNGGNNWIQVFVQGNGFINAISMTNFFNGFMVGNPSGGRWSLWKTSDGGVSWDSSGLYLPQSSSESGWNNSLYVDGTGNNMWFGTNNFRIYYSSNGGSNWQIQSTGAEQNIYTIFFSTLGGFAGGNSLLKTVNNGNNWNQISSLGNGTFGGVSSFNANVWYVRSDHDIYFSSNSGISWNIQYTAPFGTYKYIGKPEYASFIIENFAVRDSGGISMETFPYNGEGIEKISNEIPSYYNLRQNYPNPFNPETKIRFDVPKSSFVNMVVYDVLGRKIETLVHENLVAGKYQTSFTALNYVSGIYFYRLETTGYSITKKMILLK